MTMKQPQTPVSIDLRLSDEKDLYIEGDTIVGDLSVTFSGPVSSLSQTRVQLICTEHVCIEGLCSESSTKHVIDSEIQICTNEQGPTSHQDFKFTLTVPNEHGLLEPTLRIPGAENCGMEWKLRATVDVDGRAFERSIILEVYNVPTSIEQAEDYIQTCSGDHGAMAFGMLIPRWVPQAPNVCRMSVTTDFSSPTFVKHARVFLYTYVTVRSALGTRAFVTPSLILNFSVGKEIRKLRIGGGSQGVLIKGPLPSPLALASSKFSLKYELRVQIEVRGASAHSFVLSALHVGSPALLGERALAIAKAEFE